MAAVEVKAVEVIMVMTAIAVKAVEVTMSRLTFEIVT